MRLSVVTISFNQGRFLREAIESVLNQNSPLDVEYIVVDPGSTDESRSIIEGYGDRLIPVFEKDAGPADGLNKGFARATGDAFCYINADDYFLPGAFRKVAHHFATTPSSDFLCSGGFLVDSSGDVLKRIRPTKMSPRLYLRGGVTVFQQGHFFRRSVYDDLGGFDARNRISWDGQFLMRASSSGAQISYSTEALGCLRIYGETITSSPTFARDALKQQTEEAKELGLRNYGRFEGPLRRLARLEKWLRNPRVTTASVLDAVARSRVVNGQ